MSEHNELRFFSSYLLLFVFLNLTCLSFALRNCILQGVHNDTFHWWSRIRRAGVESGKIQRFFPDPDPESQMFDTRDPVPEELCIFNSIRSPLGLTLNKKEKMSWQDVLFGCRGFGSLNRSRILIWENVGAGSGFENFKTGSKSESKNVTRTTSDYCLRFSTDRHCMIADEVINHVFTVDVLHNIWEYFFLSLTL